MGGVWKSINKIIVLTWTDILAAYALYVMMPYLTNVWKMKFTHAAAIINVYIGVAMILPLGFSFLVEAFIGNYWMLLFSSAAYSIDQGFLSMSTPPVLSKATGTCNTYESACNGDVQKILFYTALPLIAIDLGGHLLSLGSFLAEQIFAAEDTTQGALFESNSIQVILVGHSAGGLSVTDAIHKLGIHDKPIFLTQTRDFLHPNVQRENKVV